MSEEIVKYELVDSTALITMDDGKANALSHAMIDGLDAAFTRAESEASAVVLAGRPGRFSAGFDLSIMMSGPEAVAKLLISGAQLMMRVYGFPKPVVVAVTGHAIAGGALLAATGDTRIGVEGEFKIGLNEVSNGMPVPILAHQLAKDRLDPREFVASVLQARIYHPEGAVRAGWLDRATQAESLLDEAMTEAQGLAALPATAYALTKASIRKASIEHILGTLEQDLKSLGRIG